MRITITLNGGFPPGDEQVNVFETDQTYLFRHYFDSKEVFDRLKRYYNNQHYRFEVPPAKFETLRSFLAEHGYDLVVTDAVEEFVVVKNYTNHPESIFKQSVIRRSVDGYSGFLMTDQAAVDRATREGAIRLTNTDVENPFYLMSDNGWVSERSGIRFDDAGERDVLPDVVYLDRRFVAGLGIGDDDDIPPFDFRDAITLLAERLDRHLPNLALLDRRVGRALLASVPRPGRLQ